jgi:ribonuclease HII
MPILDEAALIAGIDEVGRGPLAGPVVAAAVILKRPIDGVDDSKKLTAAHRERLAKTIMAEAYVGVGAASAAEIDRINILQATYLAMRRAVARLPVAPIRILVDGNSGPRFDCPSQHIVGGDGLEMSIGAASIVAKVCRDRLMVRLSGRYGGYGFERNVGYGTKEHLEGLTSLGPSVHHRYSFAPVREAATAFNCLPQAFARRSSPVA